MSLTASIAGILSSAGTIASIASILASAATIALVFLTWRYVSASKQMLTEMRQARLQEYGPDVVVDLHTDPKAPPCLFLAVRNIGRGLARDVAFDFKPSPVDSRGHDLSEAGCFRNGLKVLSPGRSIDCFYDTLIELLKEGTHAVTQFTVTVKYWDSGHSKSYSHSFDLDVGQFKHIRSVRWDSVEQSLREIANNSKELQEALRRLSETYSHAHYREVSDGLRAEGRGFDYFTGQEAPPGGEALPPNHDTRETRTT